MKSSLFFFAALSLLAVTFAPGLARAAEGDCPKYKVYYIDPATKFMMAPVPLEDHAQKVFCSASPQIDRLVKTLGDLKPIKKRASDSTARIKIVPTAAGTEPVVIHENGEVVRQMNTYRPQPKMMLRLLGALKHEAGEAKDATK